jgi:hypothetical protein
MTASRLALYAALSALGLCTGAAGALVHDAWLPGGLLLALAAAAGLFTGGAVLTGSKPGAVVPAAGWLLAVLLTTSARPEGDYLFGTGFASYAYLFGGVLAGAVCGVLARPGTPLPPPPPTPFRDRSTT